MTKMKRTILIVLAVLLLLAFGGCYVAYRLFVKASVELRELQEDVYPSFDSDEPDTRANRERFKEYLMIDLTPDIKDIYCHDDYVGVIADYMFAFSCSEATSKRIIHLHNLELDTAAKRDDAFNRQDHFDWWNKETIRDLPKYQWFDENGRLAKYFWYDKVKGKAYFFQFDIALLH